ncbi:MAG TPA: NAD(P)(+) transhydrogenase (Re/Si-specific) subunit beta [Sorangium sp.]|nr:NAD(P)(+) transhydrogenase (Re/Si-specific) subunit beta [Sorangium sp.]
MSSLDAAQLIYLVSAVLFIIGLKRMTRVRSARNGNVLSGVAMLLAVVGALIEYQIVHYQWIIAGGVVGGLIGAVAAMRVPMTKIPEMVAIFNGFGGAASAVVAASVLWQKVIEPNKLNATVAAQLGSAEGVTLFLSIIIGGVTLSGSLVAYGKLAGNISGKPILLPGRHFINALLFLGSVGLGVYMTFMTPLASDSATLCMVLGGVSIVFGIMLVLPIGGADMPVVISLLNSYSGVAASATGFVIGNNVLIISGAMVGAAGLILTQIMCVAMNRSLANVIFGGFGAEETKTGGGGGEYVNVTSCGVEEAAMILENAETMIVVPGYGLAVAQAQHAVRELADLLEANNCEVRYAIHPVAGRMPGHMNVLLAEADIPYEQLVEMDAINSDFANTDVALVIGANDVVNPAALDDKESPIYGMPILEVHHAQTVFVIKRGLGSGFAGVKNVLFERDNTMMVFGDAKKVLQGLTAELKETLR